MKYFKTKDGEVCAYDEEQVAAGYPLEPMAELTGEEVEAHCNPPKTEEQLREEWKIYRAEAVAAIKVTTLSGNIFDGDEVSTGRMLEPIAVLRDKPEGTTSLWVLADNTVAHIALPEFLEALELAGLAKTALWVA